MIRQFIIDPALDLMFVREPFKELNEHMWKTQMTLTNLLGQTKDLRFWRRNVHDHRVLRIIELYRTHVIWEQ